MVRKGNVEAEKLGDSRFVLKRFRLISQRMRGTGLIHIKECDEIVFTQEEARDARDALNELLEKEERKER